MTGPQHTKAERPVYRPASIEVDHDCKCGPRCVPDRTYLGVQHCRLCNGMCSGERDA